MASYADLVFTRPGQVDCLMAWTGVFAFSFQIYYDFSGYTDVAISCARLMGFHIAENFDRPYASRTITDFWRRWHITLSSWLRDYLYIPLGGSRMSTRWAVYRNLMITMVLGGLWHGAAWHFVLWGFIQGAFLVADKMLGRHTRTAKDEEARPGRVLLGQFVTFQLVTFSWLVFRADNLETIGSILLTMVAGARPIGVSDGVVFVWAVILAGWLKQMLGEYAPVVRRLEFAVPGQALLYTLGVLVLLTGKSLTVRPFIYFQF
jgi:alginate O-acetyltransferase complex protein AlgI